MKICRCIWHDGFGLGIMTEIMIGITTRIVTGIETGTGIGIMIGIDVMLSMRYKF